jgi:drug/metabolite transporter (DMT)-like permease
MRNRGTTPGHATIAAAPLRAAGLMLAATVMFGFMTITIRLATRELHAFEVAFFRNFFGLVFALPLLLKHGPSLLQTHKLPLYFARCVIGLMSMLCGFWAISQLPLAQAVSLSYSTPLFVTIGAVFALGETVRARRWTAVIVGFLGVMLIVRPGFVALTPGVLAALLGALLSACTAISIKFLSRTEKPDAIVLMTTLLWVPLSLPAALWVWQWPSAEAWLWVATTGALGTAGHMLWTRAFRLGDISALTPISFMQLPIVAVAGLLLFDENIDRWTIAGALVIFAANAYIAQREASQVRRIIAADASTIE